MADSSVIKEYLVSLGFKVDEKGLKNFTGQVENAGKAVFKFVAAIQGAALTIGAGVAAFASNLEMLYNAAQKTGSSATNLKAFGKAAENFGVSTQEALQSVQALASWMRQTPASEGYLRQLGIQTRDANGKLKDTTELLVGLGEALAKKPYSTAMSYADYFKISEDSMRALMKGEFAEELAKQRESLKNSGFDRAAKDAHAFMVQLRELQTQLELFALKVQEALMRKLGVSMESFSDWFQKNGPMIADRVADILMIFLKLAEVVGPMLLWMVEKLIEMDTATDGWSTKTLGLLAVMQLLGGFAVIGGILGLAGAFSKLATAIAAAGAAAGTVGKAGGAASLIAQVAKWGAGLGMLFHMNDLNSNEDEQMRDLRKNGTPTIDNPSGLMQLRKQRLAELEKKYNLPSGLLDSVWSAESGRGKNMLSPAGAQGHFQFMPGTAKQYGLNDPNDFDQSSDAAARYYRDLMAKYGGNLQKAVAAYNWGPGNVDRKGLAAAPAETRNYISKVTGAMGGGVQMSQTTHINVNGSSDAKGTANEIAERQARINAELLRNLQMAVN